MDQSFMDKVKAFFVKLNSSGLPLPMIRDPKSQTGSITATMFVITHIVAVLLLLGKVTKVVGDIDYGNVIWLYGLTGSFYLGRKVTGDKKNLTIDGENK